ncbi:MAG: hypothetical protein J5I90_13495 [Caldilineales bacterium]|nr:hypothetical protein [Caldilineales bacterium]
MNNKRPAYHRGLTISLAAIFLLAILGGVGWADNRWHNGSVGLDDDRQNLHLPFLGVGMQMPLLPPTPAPPKPHPGLPLNGFTTDDFSGPMICNNCHSALQDESGTDVTNATQWRATMMANAAQDSFWLAKVSDEIARNPELAEVIEATCSRCHMPMAYTQAIANGQKPKIFGDGFLNPANALHDAAMDGVSCTLCHQIQLDNLGQPASFDGHFVIDTSTNPPNRLLFGPYPDPDMMWQMIMRSGSQYTPVQGSHLTGSAFCATCHTLYTPFVDDDGHEQEFPEQTPYLEWLHSDYADGRELEAQCQDCHMPLADGQVTLFPGAPAREPFFQHSFVGGNTFMLKIFQANVEEMNLRASTADFEASIQRTLAQLQNQTAEVKLLQLEKEEGLIRAVVQVQNKTGHKFPTSYPARRAWLHITLRDARGEPVFESGRALSYGGILDNDNDLDSENYEPHYDVVTSPDQVQIYEAIIGDGEGEVTYTLLDAEQYVKDNRLPPIGFDKATANPDIAVAGGAATDANFVGGSDTVTYEMPVAAAGPFTVQVELMYQSLSFASMQDLRQTETTYVQDFGALYDSADKTPVIVDSVEATLP